MANVLLHQFISAYIYSVTTFLLLRLFNKSAKRKTADFLTVANYVVLAILGLNICSTIAVNIKSGRFTSAEEARPYFFINPDFFLIATIILGFAFHLLFLRKKFRINPWITIVSIVLLLGLINLEALGILFTSWTSDFLSSSWSVYYDDTHRLMELILAVAYFGMCWGYCVIKERNKNSVSNNSRSNPIK